MALLCVVLATAGGALCRSLWGSILGSPCSAPTAVADDLEPHRSPEGKVVACRECPEPNDAWYRWEMGPFFRDGGVNPDFYETDGGECKAKPLGVKVSIEGYVWEPAGEGVVQDCPSGRFSYELNVRLGPEARFDWQVDADRTRGLETGKTLGIESAADAATTGACGRGVTLSLTQRLEAAYCHRMRWAAAFLLARLRAKADYAVEKRWRWWIKNANWGSEVLYAGDTWRPCDAAHVEMTRLAPVSVHLAKRDGSCPDAECTPYTVSEGSGWVPEPPATAPELPPLRVTTVTEPPRPPPVTGGDTPAPDEPVSGTSATDPTSLPEDEPPYPPDGEIPYSPYPCDPTDDPFGDPFGDMSAHAFLVSMDAAAARWSGPGWAVDGGAS